jgi:Putative auto-transporter adhesin, head GIN domain
MKTGIIIPTLFFIILIGMTGCIKEYINGSGEIRSEERVPISSFSRIKVKGSMNVQVKQGDSIRIMVRDYSNILPYIETIVSGNTLIIDYNGAWIRNSEAEVTITLPKLNGIEVSGSSDVATLGSFNFDNLDMNVSGSGNFNVAGTAKSVNVDVSGSGEINGFDMPCDTALIRVSGSGVLRLTVNKLLDANITGSGDVLYKGNPTVQTRITGSGRVRKL